MLSCTDKDLTMCLRTYAKSKKRWALHFYKSSIRGASRQAPAGQPTWWVSGSRQWLTAVLWPPHAHTLAYVPPLTHEPRSCVHIFLGCFCKRELIGLEVLVQTHTRARGYAGQKTSPRHTFQVFQDGVTGQPAQMV